jgi:hypothetical protein
MKNTNQSPYRSRVEDARSRAVRLLSQLASEVEASKHSHDLPSLEALLNNVSSSIHTMARQQFAAEAVEYAAQA